MRIFVYVLLLLIIGIAEMLANTSSRNIGVMPDLIFTTAFFITYTSNNKTTLLLMFIAGLCSDLFLGDHMGVSCAAYIIAGMMINYFRKAIHTRNSFVQLFVFGSVYMVVLGIETLLQLRSIPSLSLWLMLLNNWVVTLLVAPTVATILALVSDVNIYKRRSIPTIR